MGLGASLCEDPAQDPLLCLDVSRPLTVGPRRTSVPRIAASEVGAVGTWVISALAQLDLENPIFWNSRERAPCSSGGVHSGVV